VLDEPVFECDAAHRTRKLVKYGAKLAFSGQNVSNLNSYEKRMKLQLSLKSNVNLTLRDPETSTLGKKIVQEGLVLMDQLGFEHFTFKKLAEHIGTTETSIYRYFENKHRLLLYLLTWYWNGLEYAIDLAINNVSEPQVRVRKALTILCLGLPDTIELQSLDKTILYAFATSETSKSYLVKEVDSINACQLFRPYKSIVNKLAALFAQVDPSYQYPHSLASTVIESAHHQHFFAEHLPSLTSFGGNDHQTKLNLFLEGLVFSVLKSEV
jgi:AcrR family transcriptional regulator